MEALKHTLYQITGVDFFNQLDTLNPKVHEFHVFEGSETNLADIVTEIDQFLKINHLSVVDYESQTPILNLSNEGNEMMVFNEQTILISRDAEFMEYRGFYITNQQNKYYIYIV